VVNFRIGDIVARKSYGGDVYFVISDIRNIGSGKPAYILRGVLYRITADAQGDDLVRQSPINTYINMQREVSRYRTQAAQRLMSDRSFLLGRFRNRPGKILHVDSSQRFLDMCMEHYRNAGIRAVGVRVDESEQPGMTRSLLQRNGADILVITGHDSMKKNERPDSLDSYSHSRYFVQSVKEARQLQPDYNKLCIFAGACQSYYEAIMSAGANFASSPGRVLINALDPAFVSEKVALTDIRAYVTPAQVGQIVISGSKGIGGIDTKGHLKKV
jgi:spore coat assemly protein